MDFSVLKSTVLGRLNMGSDDPAADLVGGYVNEGLHLVELADSTGWPWLHATVDSATVASTGTYSFATVAASTTFTVAKILDIKILNGTVYLPLEQVTAEEADRTWLTAQTAFPQIFYVEGETLYLRPLPNAAYTVRTRLVKSEPDLVLDTDTPLMPSRFHASIVAGALLLFYTSLQDTARIQLAQSQFDGWVTRMLRSSAETVDVPRVRVRDGLYA